MPKVCTNLLQWTIKFMAGSTCSAHVPAHCTRVSTLVQSMLRRCQLCTFGLKYLYVILAPANVSYKSAQCGDFWNFSRSKQTKSPLPEGGRGDCKKREGGMEKMLGGLYPGNRKWRLLAISGAGYFVSLLCCIVSLGFWKEFVQTETDSEVIQ